MYNEQTKQAIEEAIRHFSELNEAKSKLIINRLDNISNLLTKQNGAVADTIRRLTVIEGEHARRELICPHRQSINELLRHKHEIAAIKKHVRNWVIIATAIANALIGLIAHFLKHQNL